MYVSLALDKMKQDQPTQYWKTTAGEVSTDVYSISTRKKGLQYQPPKQ